MRRLMNEDFPTMTFTPARRGNMYNQEKPKETPLEYKARNKANKKKRPILRASSPPLLYVDGFNFLSKFVGCGRGQVPNTCVDMISQWKFAEDSIKVFMTEARASGWEVTVFLDNAKISEQEKQISVQRSKEKCEQGGNVVTASSGLLLGSLFTRFGANVRFALGADNDPTIAAHAFADDAAVLSGDGDFFRYYRRRASGELVFLRRIFGGFASDTRNGGLLALFARYPKGDRNRLDWTLETGHGNKGGKILLMDLPPTTSVVPELVTCRDPAGVALVYAGRPSAYPFAFPCAPAQDAALLLRPLRLAAYGLLGEHRVIETSMVWLLLNGGSATVEMRSCTWQWLRAGLWLAIPHLPDGEVAVPDSWEDGCEAAQPHADDYAFGPEEADRVTQCTGMLRLLRDGSSTDAPATLEALYDTVFPADSLARAVTHADTGASVVPSELQMRNEVLCRYMTILRYAVQVAASSPAGERLAAAAHHLLTGFATRRCNSPPDGAAAPVLNRGGRTTTATESGETLFFADCSRRDCSLVSYRSRARWHARTGCLSRRARPELHRGDHGSMSFSFPLPPHAALAPAAAAAATAQIASGQRAGPPLATSGAAPTARAVASAGPLTPQVATLRGGSARFTSRTKGESFRPISVACPSQHLHCVAMS